MTSTAEYRSPLLHPRLIGPAQSHPRFFDHVYDIDPLMMSSFKMLTNSPTLYMNIAATIDISGINPRLAMY